MAKFWKSCGCGQVLEDNNLLMLLGVHWTHLNIRSEVIQLPPALPPLRSGEAIGWMMFVQIVLRFLFFRVAVRGVASVCVWFHFDTFGVILISWFFSAIPGRASLLTTATEWLIMIRRTLLCGSKCSFRIIVDVSHHLLMSFQISGPNHALKISHSLENPSHHEDYGLVHQYSKLHSHTPLVTRMIANSSQVVSFCDPLARKCGVEI